MAVPDITKPMMMCIGCGLLGIYEDRDKICSVCKSTNEVQIDLSYGMVSAIKDACGRIEEKYLRGNAPEKYRRMYSQYQEYLAEKYAVPHGYVLQRKCTDENYPLFECSDSKNLRKLFDLRSEEEFLVEFVERLEKAEEKIGRASCRERVLRFV